VAVFLLAVSLAKNSGLGREAFARLRPSPWLHLHEERAGGGWFNEKLIVGDIKLAVDGISFSPPTK